MGASPGSIRPAVPPSAHPTFRHMPDLLEVHRGERALGDVLGASQVLPHSAHHVTHRRGEDDRDGRLRAPHELGVAGEEAHADRSRGRADRHIDYKVALTSLPWNRS